MHVQDGIFPAAPSQGDVAIADPASLSVSKGSAGDGAQPANGNQQQHNFQTNTSFEDMRQVNVDARQVHVQSNEAALRFAGQTAEAVVEAQQAASEATA
eukprot:11981806-Karenia_brevis.AAC.1